MTELAASAMNDRQRAYRAEYRRRVNSWYSGALHVAVIYAIGALAFYVYTAHITAVAWWSGSPSRSCSCWCNVFECSCTATSCTGRRSPPRCGRSTAATR